MRIVARRTGLSSHAIRVWERRYQAVEPARTDTNRRLYSEQDIERLIKLHRATKAGHSIGQIARYRSEELDALLARDAPAMPSPPPVQAPRPQPAVSQAPETYIDQALAAVRSMDAKGLETELFRAEIDLGRNKLLTQVVEPLMQQIGAMWGQGDLRVADEHMATAVMRSFLGTLHNSARPSPHAPVAVITTPAGQWHEIGALLASLTASAAGWRVIYLGPNLPAEEIAGVALQHQAQVVALSITYCGDEIHQLCAELSKLRRALGDQIPVIIGGRAAQQHAALLDAVAAEFMADLAAFSTRLETLNTAATP